MSDSLPDVDVRIGGEDSDCDVAIGGGDSARAALGAAGSQTIWPPSTGDDSPRTALGIAESEPAWPPAFMPGPSDMLNIDAPQTRQPEPRAAFSAGGGVPSRSDGTRLDWQPTVRMVTGVAAAFYGRGLIQFNDLRNNRLQINNLRAEAMADSGCAKSKSVFRLSCFICYCVDVSHHVVMSGALSWFPICL